MGNIVSDLGRLSWHSCLFLNLFIDFYPFVHFGGRDGVGLLTIYILHTNGFDAFSVSVSS